MPFGDFFEYKAGCIFWKISKKGRGCVKGREAGSIKSDGRYKTVFVNGKRYYTHRIIWEMFNGVIPNGFCIDHIDGDGLNNKLENLRLVTLSINQRNRKINKTNTIGLAGVFNHRCGYLIHCANKYAGWTKDFFEACCIRKSSENLNQYSFNNRGK